MRWKQNPLLRRIVRVVVVVFAIWVTFNCLLASTLYFYGGIDRARQADVIIVLGAGLRRDGRPDRALNRRIMHAVDLWREGVAPMIICTGGWSEYGQRTEAEGCRAVLLEEGVSAEAILMEDGSRSTEENAINSHVLMQENNWQTAVLVTDGFHLMRAVWIFADEGINVYGSPVPSSRVTFGWLIFYTAREVVALQWQFVKEALGLSNTYVQGL